MIVKVCGLKDEENITDLLQLPIDYIGLIFYEESPRYVDKPLSIPKGKSIKKVGVFVNSSIEYITQKIQAYQLDYMQLHGSETVQFCQELLDLCHIPIIKAISVATEEDMKLANTYSSVAEILLLDTKVATHGGSGIKFDWNIIHKYQADIPFLLSGGICPEDAEAIKSIDHKQFLGIDLNSKFEISPGYKDVKLLKPFIEKIKCHNT